MFRLLPQLGPLTKLMEPAANAAARPQVAMPQSNYAGTAIYGQSAGTLLRNSGRAGFQRRLPIPPTTTRPLPTPPKAFRSLPPLPGMPVSDQVRVASQPMPQAQTVHDRLIRQLQERGDWTDAHLDTLRTRLDACLEPAPTGNMRAISQWFSRNKAHCKTYRDTYMGFYEGFSESPQWMKGMSEAIARHQAARQAPAQENDSDLQRAIAASLASHKEETKARQQVQPDNDFAKAVEASLRDQEAEELQRAIAASLSNSTDVLMAEMAAGNNRFRASIASHGIEIVPNKGGAYMNSCLIASMLQHALGMHGGDKLMEDALALKLEMAERFPNEVSADGLMHADSNSPAMTWLRNEIHRRHGVWIDPHIVVADSSGKPILTEQRQPLPGHKPVVIWNEGAHFQALFDPQSGGRNRIYEMAKQASARRFA